MKRKKFILVGFLGLSLFTLAGCGIETLVFEDKEYKTDILEEKIESMLESENPQYDLDVTITEDTD